MREIEILFRGKSVNSGEWVYGDLVRIPNGDSFEYYIISDFDDMDGIYDVGKYAIKVIPETVSEFCGLTDKNGKKIFEGDIIQFGEDEEYDWEFNIGVVKFGEGTFDSGIYVYTGFFYEDRKGNIDHNTLYDWEEDWERCKVIGNIHDNPELLNKE